MYCVDVQRFLSKVPKKPEYLGSQGYDNNTYALCLFTQNVNAMRILP